MTLLLAEFDAKTISELLHARKMPYTSLSLHFIKINF